MQEKMSERHARKSSQWLLSTVLALVTAACATQPEYVAPAMDAPVEWGNALERASALSNPDDALAASWWAALRDPAIDALVLAALRDNPTLAETAARVDEANAVFAIGHARRFPRLDVTASSARERVALQDDGGRTAISWQSATSIGPSLAWEIDLWGRLKESTAAAYRRLQARDADARAARLSIAAQVANGTLSLRACNLLLAVRDADIAARQNELVIIRARVRHGALPPDDVAAAESNLAAVRIDRIAQEEVCLQTLDALVAVTGRSADEVRSLIADAGTLDLDDDLSAHLPNPPEIVPDLPATVLLRHPAVVAAEREVAARWSEIAVARAERLPRLDLTAILTGQWIRALGSTDSLVSGSAGLDMSGSFFDAGEGSAQVAHAGARYREAIAILTGTIRQTARDIEDALAAQSSAVRRVEVSQSALSAARYTLRANEARRRAGSIGAYELEASRRQLHRAQENAIVAARDRAKAWVEVIRRTSSVEVAGMTDSALASVSVVDTKSSR